MRMSAVGLVLLIGVGGLPVGLAARPPAQPPTAPEPTAPEPVPALTETVEQPELYSYLSEGRRDPFVSLLARGADLPSDRERERPDGLMGLSVNEVALRGVVLSDGAYLAVLEAPDNRTYIVRPDDRLFDGSVKEITADGIVFLQEVNDPLSLVTAREVRKGLQDAEGGPMSRWLSCVAGLALVADAAGLAARGESPAFDQRCIPPGCVASQSHTAGTFPRRALPDGHSTGLGATLDFSNEPLAAERPASVRLVEVTSESTPVSQSVLITATEPASYTTRQPDPLTVLITLRDVAAGDVATWLRPAPDDPVTSVDVLDAVDADGDPVVQVRIRLREPTVYEVRSRRQTIQVRFARPVASPPTRASKVAAAAPPLLVGHRRSATAILSVETAVDPHAISVTLHGNGVLTPGRIHESEHLPPRLVIEFPHLASEAAAVTSVEIDPVKQVRVAADSPELTRVVLDLARPAVYHIEHLGGDERILRVVFPRDLTIDPVARIGADPVSETAGAWTAEAEIPELVSGEASITGVGSTAPAALRAAPPASPIAAVAPFDITAVAPLVRLDGPVSFPVAAVPLLRPVPGDVPARVWPQIRQLASPVVAVALDAPPLLSSGPGDLPSPRDDIALRVTSPAVVAEVSAAETVPRTTAVAAVVEPAAVEAPAVVVTPVAATGAPETPPVPVAASRTPARFLPLRGSGREAGALAPRAVQVLGQPLTEQQEYTGEPISMDFQNTDLRAVLRVFAEISGLNLVIDPSVTGEVNVVLTQVPWDQAFAIILRANGLDYEVDGTVVRIASLDSLRAEAQARAQLAQSEADAGELMLYTRSLSYARAEDLTQLITDTTLSARGQVFTDARTNTLIVRDLQDRLVAVNDLLDTLDQAEPQVEIEARIVQAGHDSARALGVQWGVTGRIAQELANTLPFSFPNRGGISGRTGGTDGQGPSGVDSRALPDENAATVVNLGVGGATSAIGLTMGSVNGALNLDVILSALESEGELSIISSPRIMTQNNVEAVILQGDQIPYQTVANNTVTVQFKEAALQLRVTPQITNANTVIMEVVLENSFPDFARALGNPPIPPIVTQRATTTVQVYDGETTVIGGIYENTRTRRNNRTPMLHRIPLLGWLFKSSDQTESTDELMIFLTPRIVR